MMIGPANSTYPFTFPDNSTLTFSDISTRGSASPRKLQKKRTLIVTDSGKIVRKRRAGQHSIMTQSVIFPLIPSKVELDTVEGCCKAAPEDATLDHAKDHHLFSLKKVAWAIQNKLSPKCIERYIENFDRTIVASPISLNVPVGSGLPCCPILFYAIEQNSPELVRILHKAGAHVDSRTFPIGLPALAYAVFCAEYTSVDTTDVLITLLAIGANPRDIPEDMWQAPLKSPVKQAPPYKVGGSRSSLWCTSSVREALARNLNLMQRYALWKASSIDKPTPRMLQIAEAHDLLPLLETPFHLIGQKFATQHILRKVLNHYLFKDTKPLVLLLTGPSGHGKTELAKRMGDLLSLKIHQVDCTEMRHETDILGPKPPYQGHEKGSPLNNHLANHDGQKTVIFMDEFDKTTREVYQAMLLPFESGFYHDRRNGKKLDCTNHIWLLAANLGEDLIRRFWNDFMEDQSVAQQDRAPLGDLQKLLRARAIASFGAPLTGRLREVVPYLPFDELERAVATYKFMREIRRKVRVDINVDTKDFAGHNHLNFIEDGQLAMHIAKEGYIPELGARSLEDAVDREITDKLGDVFLRQEPRIFDSSNAGPLGQYDVKVARASDGTEEVTVKLAEAREITKRVEDNPADLSKIVKLPIKVEETRVIGPIKA